jgi:hypothetical protein
VIVFYRGAWCPFCNIALRTYQEALLPELRRRDVALVAVSPQKPDGSLTIEQKHHLTFSVLSDPGLRLADQVGVVMDLSEVARQTIIDAGLNFAAANVGGSTALPMEASPLDSRGRTPPLLPVAQGTPRAARGRDSQPLLEGPPLLASRSRR